MCHYTDSQAYEAYSPDPYPPTGHAVIDVGSGGLDDRATWTIRRYTVDYTIEYYN